MAGESTEAQEPIQHGLTSAESWLSSHSELLIQYGVNIIYAILILFIGNIIVKFVANGLAKALYKKNMDKTVVEFIHMIVRYALFIMVLIAALGRIGVQTASVVAVLGAAGLAVGLALQGSLSNFAAGVLIVIFRPFKLGDYIEVAGVSGSVDSIQIFQTILTTSDNKMVVVPNSSVISGAITNYSRHSTRRIDLTIQVSYDSDLGKAKRVLQETVAKESRILTDKAVTIGIMNLGPSSIDFVVRPWVNSADYWGVYFDLNQAIKEALDANDIGMPYPQMDIHLNKIN